MKKCNSDCPFCKKQDLKEEEIKRKVIRIQECIKKCLKLITPKKEEEKV